ncbi:SusC/RagA family TonB-linked outer membrane protein [Maribacter sp. 2210JD10-5]|uniref:SusC/RagA family TonB-linked outer membrane protein n=1 Tax=Maribacter sp. 2210JD10-5 TaxID=3386272 RepID=UPI0039BC709D
MNLNFLTKLKSSIVLLFLVFGFNGALAQQQKVNGTVSDEDAPLPGVSVVVKGTSNGTVTDFDGNYTVEAQKSDVLVFSYIGFVTKEITVGDKLTLNITLQEDVSALDEVVVIGYGTAQRKDITGSIVSVKGEALNQIKPVTFEGGLAARASGVQVVQSEGGPGAGFKIRVRGGTSINASNDPLYVIDGFAINGDPQGTATGIGNSSTSPLASIDPNTIESIEVLKDASATAIYGSRGANGVILITTKKGRKGRASLTFDNFTGLAMLVRPLDLLTGQEYVDYWNEYFPWTPTDPTNQFSRSFRDGFGNDLDLNDPRVVLTNWQDDVSRAALTNSYSLSASGGTEKTSYSGSFSYLDQEGTIKSTKFERYNGNLRIDQNVNDWLRAGVNVNIGFTKTGGVVTAATENANGRSGLLTNATLFSPVQGITRFADATYDENGRLLTLRDGDVVNPISQIQGNINKRSQFQSFGGAYVEFNITDNLKFRSAINARVSAAKGQAYFSERFGWGQTANGRAFVSNNFGTGLITNQTLSYNKTFDDHRLNVIAVYEEQQNTFEFNNSAATGFDLPGVNLDNLGSATTTLPNQSGFDKNTLKSYLGRVQYDYKGRYTLNASARYDGSSRFAEGRKYGFFPAIGVAWNIANENFLKGNKIVNNLRFKASYGETGNTQIGSYRSFAQAGVASTILNGNQIVTGAAITQLANENLTWETTEAIDIGASIGLFDNRISMEIDYYEKETTDLLLEVPLPSTSGFKTVFKNLGAISNKGWEFALNTVNVNTENFTWDSNFNISFNRNEVLDLGGAEQFFVQAIGDNQIQNDYVVRVGESLGSIIGIERDGIYEFSDFVDFDGLSDAQAVQKIKDDAAAANLPFYDVFYTLRDDVVISSGQPDRSRYRPGLPKLVDQNGDGIVNTDDRTIIGNTLPKHFGGFTNNFKYKNLDLSILTQWSYGNDIYNKNRVRGLTTEIPFFNKYGIVADRWSPDNINTDNISIWGYGDAGISGNAYNDYVEDGSYLRISNITLGYTVPRDITSKYGINNFRIYGAIDNVFIWTDYSGFDPDVSVGNNQLTSGLDSDAYPRARTFRLGLSVNL